MSQEDTRFLFANYQEQELLRRLAQAEADRDNWKKLAGEWEAWVDDALKALGVETVFDIPKAGVEQP